MHNPLIHLSETIAQLAGNGAQVVVTIQASRKASVTGFLIDQKRILTTEIGVELDGELPTLLPDGSVATASLLGRDTAVGIALLELDNEWQGGVGMPLAQGATLGELVVVVGRDPETGLNAGLGIVGGLSGAWRSWKGGKIDGFIRIDGLVGGLNHGGLVLRADGTILGLATGGLVRGATVVIPSSNLHQFVQVVEAHGELGRGYLGVGLQPIPQPAGMIVLSVEHGSPCEAANLLVGDVIVAMGGERVQDFATIQEFLEPPHIGERVPVRVVRAGQEVELWVEIGRRPGARRVA
jgi:serine protease Do